MTIRATQGTTPQTRTSYEDKLGISGIDGIVVKWEGGDGNTSEYMKVFGYDNNMETFYSPEDFTSIPNTIDKTTGLSISFTGNTPQGANHLAVYPAENCTPDPESKKILFDFRNQQQDCTSDKEMEHLKKYDIMVGKPVATTNGKVYAGTLQTPAGQNLTAGKCYTLKPKLELTEKLSVPPL